MNLSKINNFELLDSVIRLNKQLFVVEQYLMRNNPELLNELIYRTSFLDEIYGGKKLPIKSRLYCLENNIENVQTCKCPGCNNKVKWNPKTNTFRQYCCSEHVKKDKSYWDKVYHTNVIKYGCKFPTQNKDVIEKIKSTNVKNLGVEFPLQSEIVKNKLRSTNRLIYGTDYALQNQDVRNKCVETWMSNLGVVNPMKSSIVQNKAIDTNLQKRSVKYPMQDEEVKMKTKKTNNLRYGCDYSASSEIVKKKIIEYFLNTYGVVNPFQLESVKLKSKQTMMHKYGVEYYVQSNEYHKNKKHKFNSIKYPGVTFDSTWEVKVYEFCRDNNINVEYSPNISFKYDYMDKCHTYHPDFKIGDKIVEVKGGQFFDEFNKMINPYDRTQDGKYESKHQCMVKNNVLILRNIDETYMKHCFLK